MSGMPTLTPADPSFVAQAPQRLVVSREVPASPTQVWEWLIDTPGWADWFPGCKKGWDTSNPAGGIGGSRSVKIGPISADEQFIIWEPNKAWGFTILKFTIPGIKKAIELVELEDRGSDSGPLTVMTYTGAFEFSGFGRVLWPMLKGSFESSWAGGFEALAERASGATV